MAGWSELAVGLKMLVLGGAAVSAAAVATVVWQDRHAPAADPPLPPPVASSPPVAAPSPVSATDASVVPAVRTEALAAVPPAPGTVPQAILHAPPSFDVVRVEPDGASLVAGRAEAGLDVAVLIDGAQTALVRADPQGRFVVFLTLPPSSAARMMTLELRPAVGPAVVSVDQVVLAPNEAPAAPSEQLAAAPEAILPKDEVALTPPPTAGAMPEVVDAAVGKGAVTPAAVPGPKPDGETASAVVEPGAPGPAPEALPVADPSQTATAPPETVAGAVPMPPPAAPTALLLSGKTVKVLQSGQDTAAIPQGTVSIDVISYTAGGDVALSGRGAAKAFVRLYLDNRALLETGIGEDGTWGGTLPAVAPGVYTLRADQITAKGQVTSRYETPFQREDPLALATPAPSHAPEGGAVSAAQPRRVSITVQPGFTLWQIARANYGDGLLYVRLYDANKTLIRNPDLIYPGQVFTVPGSE